MSGEFTNLARDDVLQAVFDGSDALNVNVSAPLSLDGEVKVDLDALGGDNVALKDPSNGNTLAVNADGSINIDGAITGDVDANVPPPTDFRPLTVAVTGTAAAISFSGFTITSITIKALPTNPGLLRIGKSNVLTTSDEFYLLTPGESVNIPLAASSEPIYHVTDPSEPAGTYRLTVLAVN